MTDCEQVRPLVSNEALEAFGAWLMGWPLAVFVWWVVISLAVARLQKR